MISNLIVLQSTLYKNTGVKRNMHTYMYIAPPQAPPSFSMLYVTYRKNLGGAWPWGQGYMYSTHYVKHNVQYYYCNNIHTHTLHLGHTNPLIFSTTPITGRFTFRQKLISFLTSISDTSWGVVIMTAPSTCVLLRYCTIERCSSDVPGGVSITR